MHKKFILLPIALTIFLDFFNLGLIFPIFTSFIFEGQGGLIPSNASLFYKNVMFGLLVGIFPFGQFLSGPFIGKYADLYGRQKLLLITLLGTVTTLLICGLSVVITSLVLLFIGRFLGGVVAGNMGIAHRALSDFYTAQEEKTNNFSLVSLISGLGFAAGPYFSGTLTNPETGIWGGEALPFWMAALFSFINFLVVAYLFPETPRENLGVIRTWNLTTKIKSLIASFESPLLRPYFLILFLMVTANLLFVQFAGAFVIEKFSIPIQEIGYLYINMGLSVALGHLLISPLISSLIPTKYCLGGSLAFLSIFLFIIPWMEGMFAVHILTALIMLACAVAFTHSLSMVSNKVPQELQGIATGVSLSVQSLAEFLPAMVIGLIAFVSESIPLFIASVAAFGAFFLLLRQKESRRKSL